MAILLRIFYLREIIFSINYEFLCIFYFSWVYKKSSDNNKRGIFMSIKNKKFLSFVLSFAMVLSILVVPANISHAEGNETLTIVHVNDMHGRVAENAGNKELGFAKLASVVNGLRESDTNVLFLNAGDTF
ncbi:hypothetical protein HKB01_05040, partial [Vibrio parahaemolyticus]|nr:hypothetical protein [Vibrio parahaemolyticus]NMR96634.1 hypothetical protein [Vibrio parahaemolyticus]